MTDMTKKELKKTMTKKAFAEYCKSQRNMNGFNTGTISMKSVNDYDRKKEKRNLKKMLDNI